MNELLKKINEDIYLSHDLSIENLEEEKESQAYGACQFFVNGLKVISRNAKITPTKIGQFVTIWKRSEDGVTEPLKETDAFDLLVIHVLSGKNLGQFVFPKSILIEKGIITARKRVGKRGIRVYPPWDTPSSERAIKTQLWQNQFFFNARSSKHDVARFYTKIS